MPPLAAVCEVLVAKVFLLFLLCHGRGGPLGMPPEATYLFGLFRAGTVPVRVVLYALLDRDFFVLLFERPPAPLCALGTGPIPLVSLRNLSNPLSIENLLMLENRAETEVR